uniref:Uncharacterized protein n=1 Tax=Ditylenchus dipsaci TaxID=166011 RepID=A0A915DRW0_9BILA
MNIELIHLIFILLALNFVSCFHRYVPQLQMAIPNKNGIYEFEFVLEHKLTMSRSLRNGRQAIMDYYPDTKSWSQRDPTIFTACDQNYTVLKDADDVLKKVEVLETVVQHTGKHWRIVMINGQSPGDVIVVPLGAEVKIRVKNRLPSELSLFISWPRQENMWFTDGVAFVQQCPIAAGSEHTYNFIADTPGTHWYHGHLMNDRADGLLGGFVIKRPQEIYKDPSGQPLPVRREYYSILQDWATTSSSEQWLCHVHSTMKWVGYGFDELGSQEAGARKKCWAPKRTFDGSNVGGSIPLEAILVGDKGWYSQKDLRERPSRLPLTTYEILAGQNILIRLVNGDNNCSVSQGLMIWVEDHDFYVVAADGALVFAKKVDALVTFPGERYDILIKGLEKPTRRYYRMIIETMEYYNWDWTIGPPQIGLANLKYEKGHYEEVDLDKVDFEHSKCTQETKCTILNCPFAQFPSSKVVDQEVIQKKTFVDDYREIFMNMHFDNHVDGWMYKSPKGLPYYHHGKMDQVAKTCDASKCDRMHAEHWDHSCDCFVHYNFTLSDIVQLTVYNMGDGGSVGSGYSHPLHIHGTHFYLMKIGYAEYHSQMEQ